MFPNFLRNHHTDIQRGCTSLRSCQQCRNGLCFPPQPLQHKLPLEFVILATLSGVREYIRVLICISLLTKGVEHFLKCLPAILDSSESCLFRSVLFFFIGLCVLWVTMFLSSLYILEIRLVCVVSEDLFPFCRLSFRLVDLCLVPALQKYSVSGGPVCAAGIIFI